MRILLAASPAAIAVALAYPAAAQETPPAQPPAQAQRRNGHESPASSSPARSPTRRPPARTTDDRTENEIVVVANIMRGAVKAPQPPVVELNEQDIASYGASSLADLIDAALDRDRQRPRARQRTAGVPGQRPAGLQLPRDESYPPEAIKRVQVLSEEVAQKYGFPPDQRVINFILKDNFSSKTGELQYGQPFKGGTSTVGFEGTTLNIAGNNRLNFDLKLNHTSPLTEAERGVDPDDRADLSERSGPRRSIAPWCRRAPITS